MIDQIFRSIDDQKGLKRFVIESLKDQNSLQSWPLSQVASMCGFLKEIKIVDLQNTTEENRSKLLEFVGMVASTSVKLQTVHIENT